MFARPRLKKSAPPPSTRKRKFGVEEISFDNDARSEYLTGFHKRKVQRIKDAQEQAAVRERQEKIVARKQMREERQKQLERHVESVNALLKEAETAGQIDEDGLEDEWTGIAEELPNETIDEEEEYIDEDKYTHVTVESVTVSRGGIRKPGQDDEEGEESREKFAKDADSAEKKTLRQQKHKKKKFRYETKVERQITQRKQKAKGKLRSKG